MYWGVLEECDYGKKLIIMAVQKVRQVKLTRETVFPVVPCISNLRQEDRSVYCYQLLLVLHLFSWSLYYEENLYWRSWCFPKTDSTAPFCPILVFLVLLVTHLVAESLKKIIIKGHVHILLRHVYISPTTAAQPRHLMVCRFSNNFPLAIDFSFFCNLVHRSLRGSNKGNSLSHPAPPIPMYPKYCYGHVFYSLYILTAVAFVRLLCVTLALFPFPNSCTRCKRQRSKSNHLTSKAGRVVKVAA